MVDNCGISCVLIPYESVKYLQCKEPCLDVLVLIIFVHYYVFCVMWTN